MFLFFYIYTFAIFSNQLFPLLIPSIVFSVSLFHLFPFCVSFFDIYRRTISTLERNKTLPEIYTYKSTCREKSKRDDLCQHQRRFAYYYSLNGAYPMRSNVENDAGEGSVSAFDDRYVLHRRPEARRRHVVVVVVLAVDSCQTHVWATL